MNLSYFLECTTFDEAKKLYRTKAKQLHPDINKQREEAFKELVNQWEYINDSNIEFPLVKEKNKVVEDTPKFVSHKHTINDIIKYVRVKGHKTGFIYFLFLETLKVRNEKVTKDDLEYLAFKLGYSQGWVYYKCQELGI